MKKFCWFLPLLLLVCSCQTKTTNQDELEKNEYLSLKNNLQEQEEYTKDEELPCNITFSLEQLNEEEISYQVLLDNPKENMTNIKMILIHDYFTEDIFPTIGIFDDEASLMVNNNNNQGLTLKGTIETTKTVKELDLEMKLLVQYEDTNQKEQTIYYKST